jgi:glutathione S-transferase
MSIQLFGSLTSPYVRRVRIVLNELGQSFDWLDTTTDAGQAALRAATPLWKIPIATIDGETLFDSGVINQRLLSQYGPGSLAPFTPTDWHARNTMSVIDGVLDSLINVFYLGKEGVSAHNTPYVKKQTERAVAAMTWLEQRTRGAWLSDSKTFGLLEIALVTALEWMRFRSTYPVANHPTLIQFLAAHAERPSVRATMPPE